MHGFLLDGVPHHYAVREIRTDATASDRTRDEHRMSQVFWLDLRLEPRERRADRAALARVMSLGTRRTEAGR